MTRGTVTVVRALAAALPLIFAAALLAGCGASPGPQTLPATTKLTESSLIEGAYANPVDSIMFPDDAEQSLITASLEGRIKVCMSAAGYTYHSGDGLRKHRTAVDAQYTYSVTDPATAAELGFRPASWNEAVQGRPDSGTRPEGYEEALIGDSDKKTVVDVDGISIGNYDPGSCWGKAMDAVTPGWARQERLFTIATELLLTASTKADSEPRVKAANAKWSVCMAKAGFDYAKPMDANNDERFITDRATAEEISVAVASATCQHSSGLLRIWSKVRAELTQRELDKHPGIVTEWLKLQAESASRAKAAN